MTTIDDLDEDFILCNVCNTEYDDEQRAPKLLPCLHTLCNDCTLNAVKGSVVRCFICREEHRVSSELDFTKDTTMMNMMDMIKIQKKSSTIKCSDCPDDNKGEQFCKDCFVFLCTECKNAHKRTQLTRKHAILSIEDLKGAGIGSFSRKELCSVPGHEDQPLSFYCMGDDGQKSVCTQCVVGDHGQSNGNVIRNLDEVYDESKLHVERLIGELLTKISLISSSAKAHDAECNVIETKRNQVKGDVDKLFDALEATLRKRRAQLKERVDVICQERKSLTAKETDKLQNAKSDMENSCNYASRMLVFTNKPEFLNLANTVVTKLTRLLNASYEANRPDSMEIGFKTSVDEKKFQNIVNEIGEIKTNIFESTIINSPKMNGIHRVETDDVADNVANDVTDFKLPYKGPPINPPGTYTTNKTNSVAPKPVNYIRPAPKVEPLKLDLLTNEETVQPVRTRGVKTSPSPTTENVLGRPLALKSPVITPTRQPTSLGDFLKAQDKDNEQERQLPKTPQSPITSPEEPVSKTQSLNSTFPSFHSKINNSVYLPMGYQSPPPRDMTSSLKFGAKSPSVPEFESSRPKFINTYPNVKQPSPRKPQSPGGRPIVFGDISCPDFQMDATSAHHEREVSSDGRTLRNKKTDIFGGSTIDLDNGLVQYKGAIGTFAIKDQGKVYFEVDVVYNIQQPLEETWLVFELGLCRLDDVDLHHTVERHEHARSFYVARYPEDGKLTQEFWHNRELLSFSPLSDNSPGIEVRITYGMLVDTKKKKWAIADCNNNKVLHSFEMLDFSEALYPVFGCYNPDLCTVEITLKTGSEITMVPQCIRQPGFRSP